MPRPAAIGRGPIPPPAAIITDIEGTTTPVAFVRDTLFPYARDRLPSFLATQAHNPEVAALVADATALAEGRPALEALLGWMEQDAKVTPLKALQGLIWEHGYANGDLLGRIYPDVAPALRAWHKAGIKLFVYSSGSEAAQRLIFGHSDAGNLAPLFSGFFDTRVGAKREPASYTAIAHAIGQPPGSCLFLSDIAAELDAADSAGMGVYQLARPQDGTIAGPRHPAVADFAQLRPLIG